MPDILFFFGEVALRTSLILSITFILLFLMRKSSASQRHLVMVLGLLVVTFAPFGILLSPKISWTISLPQQPTAVGTTEKLRTLLEKDKSPLSTSPAPLSDNRPLTPEVFTISNGLVALIVGGMLVQMVWLGLAAWSWQKIRRQAVKALLPDEMLARMIIFTGAKEIPPIFVSNQITVPLLVGWLRPAVLLPKEVHQWQAERLAMVLYHELAHFRRGDSMLIPLICTLRIFYWWNPLVWLALARLLRERENACDDLVLNQNVRATDYADLIVSTARKAKILLYQDGVLTMASRSDVGERIRVILNTSVNRRPANRASALIGVTVACVLGWFLVAAQLQAENSSMPEVASSSPSDSRPRVEMSFVIVAIDDKVYSEQHDKIKEAVELGDMDFLRQTKGVSFMAVPSLASPSEVNANYVVLKPYSYPTTFDKGKDGTPIPGNFKTRELGLRLEATPRLTADRKAVDVSFTFSLQTLEGSKNISPGVKQPIFNSFRIKSQMLTLIDGHGFGLWFLDQNPHPPAIDIEPYGLAWTPNIDATPRQLALIVGARRIDNKASESVSEEGTPVITPSLARDESLQHRYFEIYLKISEADKSKRRGDYHFALVTFQDCYSKLQTIHQSNPNWEPALLVRRMGDCKSEIDLLADKGSPTAP